MIPGRSHYEVLGVPEDASLEEIRRAYRALVRRYHPDHLGGRSSATRSDAEDRIRELNAAWQVLRDTDRRGRYDRQLPGRRAASDYSPFPPGTEPEPPAGFDEWFADADRRHAAAKVVTRDVGPAKPFRGRLLIGLGVIVLVGILLVVFITGAGDDEFVPAVGAGACVRVDPGPYTVEVPCDEPNDGRVSARVRVSGECPAGSEARRLSADDVQLTCLVPERVPVPEANPGK